MENRSKTLSLLREAFLAEDPSGYSQAQAHPEPMDPNDRLRQQTQARSGDYPYDMPVMYGRDVGTDMGGAAYQLPAPDGKPPVPQHRKASDWQPKDAYGLQSGQENEDRGYDALDPDVGRSDYYEPGSQADDAAEFGYGKHGLGGDGLGLEDYFPAHATHKSLSDFLDSEPDHDGGDRDERTTYDEWIEEMSVSPEEIPST